MVKLILNLHSDAFEKGLPVFHAGKEINGDVKFTLKNKTNCKRFIVKIIGKAIAFQGRGNRKFEYFVDSTLELLPEGIHELNAGDHKYKFNFELPLQIPQSFRRPTCYFNGGFQYYCKARLDTGKMCDDRCKQFFIFKRRDVVNIFPELCRPLTRRFEKRFFGFGGKSEPISMKLTIPHGGIAAGETVLVKIQYDNQSNCDIEKTKIILYEYEISINMETETIYLIKDRSLVTDFTTGVNRNEFKEIRHNLKVPDNCRSSDLLYSYIYSIRHEIIVYGIVKGMHLNPEVAVPVIIGSVRLTDDELVDLGPMNRSHREFIAAQLQHEFPYDP